MYYQESRVQVIVNSLLAVSKRQFFSAEKYLHMEISSFVLMVCQKVQISLSKGPIKRHHTRAFYCLFWSNVMLSSGHALLAMFFITNGWCVFLENQPT